MPQFKLDGLILKIPRSSMNDNIQEAIDLDQYARNEGVAAAHQPDTAEILGQRHGVQAA